DAERGRAVQQQGACFVECKDGRVVSALCSGGGVLQRDRRLAGAGRARNERAGAPIDAASEQLVECRDAAGDGRALEGNGMLGRREPGVHLESARNDPELVVPAAKVTAAELDHLQLASNRAIGSSALLQRQYAV